jgi:hypothetical protein
MWWTQPSPAGCIQNIGNNQFCPLVTQVICRGVSNRNLVQLLFSRPYPIDHPVTAEEKNRYMFRTSFANPDRRADEMDSGKGPARPQYCQRHHCSL